MGVGQFEERKRDHIRHALDSSSQAEGATGLDALVLPHEALPDLDFAEVSLEEPCLGRLMATPFYISGMTAGHSDAVEINRRLALACAERGWGMGVGSQRRQLDHPEAPELDQWAEIRRQAPALVLFGNVGIAQVIGVPVDRLRRLVDTLEAQALCVHLNPLQEALQPEGTPNFKGALVALEKLCQSLEVPVVLKETGCGISRATLRRLKNIGLAAVDVAGLGGTHWGRIEGARAREQAGGEKQFKASLTFANWGIPTAEAVTAAKDSLSSTTEVWASGGVRSGLDAAKLVSLGANRIGFARPALEAALDGPDAIQKWMDLQEFELKVALFCTGSKDPAELRRKGEEWKRSES